MLAVYSQWEKDLRRIASRLPDGMESSLTTDWDEFVGLSGQAPCSLAVISSDSPHVLQRIQSLALRRPDPPLVLAAPVVPSIFQRLPHLPVTEAIPLGASSSEIAAAVRVAAVADVLEEAAREIEAADTLAPSLRHVLAHACRVQPPLTSVGALARVADLHPGTLHRRLRPSSPKRTLPSLKTILDWIVILRALPRAVATSWERTANYLGCSSRSLRRTVSRRLGTIPSRLGAVHLPEVQRKFRERVLGPLTGRNATK